MAYTCTIYSGTGFNPVNIPDSPTLITENYTGKELSALQIVQERFLQNVNVAAGWDDVKNADYCKIGNFYYFVTGISMVSPETAQLDLVPDFITSAGGPKSVQFLDGITDRHHVAKSDDTFGAYIEDDSYMSPSKPLELVSAGWKGGDDGTDETFMVSTLDLTAMGSDDYIRKGVTYKDPTSGESVTTPELEYTAQSTNYIMPDQNRSAFLQGITTFRVGKQELNGANMSRNLGVETAITNQYAIPEKYVSDTPTDDTGARTSMSGVKGIIDSGLPFEYATVRNKRVLYGSLNKYGIITASGNKADFNPEDIKNGDTASFQYITDVRPQGRPYFAPQYFHGNTDIWSNNPIGGEGWRDVPLIYTQKSGNIQDAYDFKSNRKVSATQREANVLGGLVNGAETGSNPASWFSGLRGKIGQGMMSLSKVMTGSDDPYASITGRLGSFLNDTDWAGQVYDLQRRRELYDFGVSQNVIAPEVSFPYSDGTIRDYVGNNLFIYRYRLADSDVKKIDKILTMYGYKDTAPLVPEFFTNRPQFNYVQATGVSIGGNLPQWWKAGIVEQLRAGVRVWHIIPTVSAYTANE